MLPPLPLGPRLQAISPMLLGVGTPFSDPDWLFEVKYDGYRVLAEWDGDHVRLQSRNGGDASRWFPEVTASLAGLRQGRHIVDGEVCVLDDIGRSDFDALHARDKRRGYKAGDPVVVYCVVRRAGARWPRRDGAAPAQPKAAPREAAGWRHPVGTASGPLRGSGPDPHRQAVELKLEGTVAKRSASPYVLGARSNDWLKIKRPGGTRPERFKRAPLE